MKSFLIEFELSGANSGAFILARWRRLGKGERTKLEGSPIHSSSARNCVRMRSVIPQMEPWAEG